MTDYELGYFIGMGLGIISTLICVYAYNYAKRKQNLSEQGGTQ